MFELAGDRSRDWSELTILGHKDLSLGKEDPAVKIIAASITATCWCFDMFTVAGSCH